MEVCGLPGTGKTQFCMQLCAAAQMSHSSTASLETLQEAIFVDAEGSFTAERYAQMCKAILRDQGITANDGPLMEAALRKMHVCRTYDAAEMYSTVKNLGDFLKTHRKVRVLVVDSIAFCFRHEFVDNNVQRARILTDIAATLRRYGTEHDLVVVVTNHMTTRFDRSSENEVGWLAPALGETWAHQPSTQLRFEKQKAGGSSSTLGKATLTKSMEQAVGRSCLFQIKQAGIRDVSSIEA